MHPQFCTVGQKNGYIQSYLNHRLKAGYFVIKCFIYHGHMVVPIDVSVTVLGANLEYLHFSR